MLISALKQPAQPTDPPISATVGSTPILSQDQPQPLPVNNGKVTMYVGSKQPFDTPAIATDTATKLPDKTYATILNQNGEKVGQLSDYTGLPAQGSGTYRVVTQDANGAIVNQAKIAGGTLNGSPSASFSKPSYKPLEKGTLLLGNYENYQKAASMTKFGGAANISKEPIRIVPLSDVSGLPAEAPFGTTKLNFVAQHPGEALVAVYFPRAVPPKRVADAGNNEILKESNAQFEGWLSKFAQSDPSASD
jgi:hypothetical protein